MEYVSSTCINVNRMPVYVGHRKAEGWLNIARQLSVIPQGAF